VDIPGEHPDYPTLTRDADPGLARARCVVLTSRRGREFLDTDAMPPTKLEVAYLEKRHDFVLRIEASDATSSLATSQLVHSLEKPLGGAILMPSVLSDGLFANQTEAGFEKVMDAKWGALSTFNDVRSNQGS